MRPCVCGKPAYQRQRAGPTGRRKRWSVLVDRCPCGRMYAVKNIPVDQQKWLDRWNRGVERHEKKDAS